MSPLTTHMSSISKENLIKELQDTFHLSSFRLGQEEIISSILLHHDVLAILPTGGGKSLCYQLPSLIKGGLTLVISPLIALMNDQSIALRRLRIPAGCIHSGMNMDQRRQIFKEMKTSDHYILYLSPERTKKPGFIHWLRQQNVALFAIDEAHCISQWGHDFRPEYAQLSTLREIKPKVPMVALTATATPLVKQDIIRQLSLQKPHQHVYGFYRPNLYYQVEFCYDDEDKKSYVTGAIQQTPHGRVLIYCGTRKHSESWAEYLVSLGESATFYHAGMPSTQRIQVETAYQNGDVRILAATNAFGMGIDHPDVRLVIHTQMPGNIESYYQEIGRAGRDGQPSTCLLTYSKKDKGLQAYFIDQADVSKKIRIQRWTALKAMTQYAESSECRHGEILTYFKDKQRIKRCGHCSSCAPQSPRRITSSENTQHLSSSSVRKRSASITITPRVKKQSSRKKINTPPHNNLTQKQKIHLETLRQWRRNYARQQDVPVFMVCSDAILREFIIHQPQNFSELKNIQGLKSKQIESFGQEILNQINSLTSAQ